MTLKPSHDLTLRAIRALLGACGLPSDDLCDSDLQNFDVALGGDRLRGAVAVEVVGRYAVLRSLAVAPGDRGRGLGRRLVERAEARARLTGAREVYLLTTAAEPFFSHLGYRREPRESVPAEVLLTRQFASGCCACATVMARALAG